MFGFAEGNGQTPGAASGAQPQGGEGDPPGLFGWAKTDGVANSRAGEPAALQRTSPGGQSAPAEIGMRPAIGQITDQSATSVFHETSNMSPKNKVASQLQRATTNRLSANTGARVDVHIEFTSPRGHPLKYTSQAPPNYPSGAYTCDMCAMTKYFTEGGCWHSSVDQYDLCPQCAALVKHKGITSAPLVPQMGPGAGGGVSPLASRGPPGTGGMGTGFIGSPRTRTFNSLRTPTASPRRTQSAIPRGTGRPPCEQTRPAEVRPEYSPMLVHSKSCCRDVGCPDVAFDPPRLGGESLFNTTRNASAVSSWPTHGSTVYALRSMMGSSYRQNPVPPTQNLSATVLYTADGTYPVEPLCQHGGTHHSVAPDRPTTGEGPFLCNPAIRETLYSPRQPFHASVSNRPPSPPRAFHTGTLCTPAPCASTAHCCPPPAPPFSNCCTVSCEIKPHMHDAGTSAPPWLHVVKLRKTTPRPACSCMCGGAR